MSIRDTSGRAAMLRHKLTGESYPRSRERNEALSLGEAFIPAGSVRQQRLERWLFACIARPFRRTGVPLGIRYVVPCTDGLVIHLDDCRERIRDILANILPFAGDEHPDEVYGVPGLRVSDWKRGLAHLSVPGETAAITFAGFPYRTWEAAWREVEEGFTEVDGLQRFWCDSPGALHQREMDFLTRWDSTDGEEASWWLASGILRRIHVFGGSAVPTHVKAWSYPGRPGDDWVIEVLCTDPRQSHIEMVNLLTVPGVGLPLDQIGLECYCGDGSMRSCKAYLHAQGDQGGSLQIQFNRRRYGRR